MGKTDKVEELLQRLWKDYSSINKQADGIYKLLVGRGETVLNDHIAFRTFNIPKVGIDVLAKPFVEAGYKPKGEYTFPEKKLYARHFEHKNEGYPKIFISELKLEECSKDLQKTCRDLVDQIQDTTLAQWDFCLAGVPWRAIPYSTYEKLKDESEYAGWMSVFGFRANHFTVFVNHLKTFKSLEELNAFLKQNGYTLNSSGGEIKGSSQNDFLEQSSTMAHPVQIRFADCEKVVPGCYYEFAKRYPLPNGKLFQGFVAKSADKIFESTDNKNAKKK
jgi:hypothetical protein